LKVRVVYYSETGNTAKVARAIAEEAGCEAENLAPGIPDEGKIDLLILGGALYATYDHDINPILGKYIAQLDPTTVGAVALFSTGFGSGAVSAMRRRLESRGLKVLGDSFFCPGKLFLVFNFGRPNRRDLEAARRFAQAFK
jgi:flavodoxin